MEKSKHWGKDISRRDRTLLGGQGWQGFSKRWTGRTLPVAASLLGLLTAPGLADDRHRLNSAVLHEKTALYDTLGQIGLSDSMFRTASGPEEKQLADTDGDGIPNEEDPDIDGDGLPNIIDPDVDGDGILNAIDYDIDSDFLPNTVDLDMDGDGLGNYDESETDSDGDGIANTIDADDDNDGIPDEEDPLTPQGYRVPSVAGSAGDGSDSGSGRDRNGGSASSRDPQAEPSDESDVPDTDTDGDGEDVGSDSPANLE